MTTSTSLNRPIPRKRAVSRTAFSIPPQWPRTAKIEVPLFPKINVASTFFQRMRGLLGSKPEPRMLMIAPCRRIHTYGMSYPIHVAFFDRDGIVIDSERYVPPGSKRSCERASGVLEMPAIFENDRWFSAGDHLRLAPPEASRP